MVVRVDRVTKIMKETCNTTKLITDYPVGTDKKVIREVMHDDDNFEEKDINLNEQYSLELGINKEENS